MPSSPFDLQGSPSFPLAHNEAARASVTGLISQNREHRGMGPLPCLGPMSEALNRRGHPPAPSLSARIPRLTVCGLHAHLDHVLDAAVGMLLNHGLDPYQGLDLLRRVKVALTHGHFTQAYLIEGKLRPRARDHLPGCEPSVPTPRAIKGVHSQTGMDKETRGSP